MGKAAAKLQHEAEPMCSREASVSPTGNVFDFIGEKLRNENGCKHPVAFYISPPPALALSLNNNIRGQVLNPPESVGEGPAGWGGGAQGEHERWVQGKDKFQSQGKGILVWEDFAEWMIIYHLTCSPNNYKILLKMSISIISRENVCILI